MNGTSGSNEPAGSGESMQASGDEARDPLEELAAEFTERLRHGEGPTIAEYAERHPSLAAEILDLFPTINAVERVKATRRFGSDGCVILGGERLERLGDFRILREIGRGGMGIVYEAEQESLGRRVAVKVLPRQALLDSKHLRRFEREARMAAGLHHTNIVPVFGVGEHEGYHYYVMQFIDGVGVDRVIEKLLETGGAAAPLSAGVAATAGIGAPPGVVGAASLLTADVGPSPAAEPGAPAVSGSRDSSGSSPTSGAPVIPRAPLGHSSASGWTPPSGRRYWQAVATIGVQAAEALDYAHSHGVLHRDIKPGNLLVDAAGVVWVTDFGLAKALGQDDVSQAGDIVGTLRYIAPEQLEGRFDARSDVYSLGLTLYELLTLRPAFEDVHRSSLIKKISQGTPMAPRKIRPHIPRDLETIVLKAISREPGHRYSSAKELSLDLRRYLEDRPIHARRIHPVARFWRWARRERTVASLAAAASALVVLVAVVATVGYVRTKSAMDGELVQRKKAETVSALATDALERIFQRFAPGRSAPTSDVTVEGSEGEEIEVPVQPVLSREAAALLDQLLVFYGRLSELEGDDRELREKAAEAHRRVGDIRQRLGDIDAARAAYTAALAKYEELRASEPGIPRYSVEIARVHNELGKTAWASGQPGHVSHRAALEVLASVKPVDAAAPSHRFELARAHYFLGRLPPPDSGPAGSSGPPGTFGPPGPDRSSRAPEQDRRQDRKPGVSQEPQKDGPPDGSERPERPRRSERPGEESRGWRGGTGREGPFGMSGTWKPNDELLTAIGILEPLVAEHPGVPDYRELLALSYRELSRFSSVATDAGAPRPIDKATEILRRLVADFPDVPDYRYDLAETLAVIEMPGGFFFGPRPLVPQADRERLEEQARTRLTESIEILDGLIAAHPNVPDYASAQVRTLLQLAETERRAGKGDTAVKHLERAASLQAALAGRYPEVTAYRVWLALTRDAEARLRLERGEKQEALAALDSSIASLDALLTEQPELRHVRGLLARSYGIKAEVLKGMGEQAKADEALSKMRALREQFPGGGWPFPREPRKDGERTRETRDRGDRGNRPDRGDQPDREDPAP